MPLRCGYCGGPLSGKQTRWCSEHHAILGRAHAHRPERRAAQQRWRARVKAGRPAAPTLPEQLAYYRDQLAAAQRAAALKGNL